MIFLSFCIQTVLAGGRESVSEQLRVILLPTKAVTMGSPKGYGFSARHIKYNGLYLVNLARDAVEEDEDKQKLKL